MALVVGDHDKTPTFRCRRDASIFEVRLKSSRMDARKQLTRAARGLQIIGEQAIREAIENDAQPSLQASGTLMSAALHQARNAVLKFAERDNA